LISRSDTIHDLFAKDERPDECHFRLILPFLRASVIVTRMLGQSLQDKDREDLDPGACHADGSETASRLLGRGG